ncbi:hypothetical protein [Streptomyces sp. S.PB5]|uniref:hypothetical protein n=1 Tax=Streptomyces sp. S.PB5 TaxID=3020844 RepID=UPI0025B14105|nr:hypothetical protein [Streptomyces sp. S.PB5]MDN3029239.1 hypothetical protein [Streptomyces sp. S.PB5]
MERIDVDALPFLAPAPCAAVARVLRFVVGTHFAARAVPSMFGSGSPGSRNTAR